jgi:menaquinol-cytochrome c reductase iron-sulfur subunit
MITDELQASGGSDRRGFVRGVLAMITGTLSLLGPLVGGLAVVLEPLRQRKHGQAGEFIKVGQLASLPNNGLPKKYDILADRQDAWNRYPNVPVGSIYLRRTEDDQITAFNIICPHAGCFVQVDQQQKQYNCPCHNSQFKLDGSKSNADNPSPRGMDPLDVEIRNGDEIWVHYQSFKTGVADRIPNS